MKTVSTVLIGVLLTFVDVTAQVRIPGPNTPEEWFAAGQRAVQEAKQLTLTKTQAKNVILFVGDGMSISTITAARILEGQLRGESGEENRLSFEKFPYVALSKTYTVDQQTPDSAPTMTAMVTGVKTNDRTLSVDQFVKFGEPDAAVVKKHALKTVLEMAEEKGLSTGVVTTTRVTHATPAACYAHIAERDWEGDKELPAGATVPDIARQLIEFPFGNGLEVALGGGREYFLPNTLQDPEEGDKKGTRKDGRDLTQEWLKKYPNAAFVWNRAQFTAINAATTNHLLGLFERSHMEFEADREKDTGGEPSLSEMTAKAIEVLQKNKKGFFLMVEGGRIDHGHHAGNAFRALTDAVEFAKAVHVARENTKRTETLIIVTADHSHTFTIVGYPKRGNPILGKVVLPDKTEPERDMLGRPYTTLSYANGPGYTGESHNEDGSTNPQGAKTFPHRPRKYTGITAGRPDLQGVDTTSPNYLQESTVPLGQETHAGEDVAIYADGPLAHLIHGTLEQNVIAHVIMEALRLKR
ncbi:MAG: alkaline phosphatase [Deltaproteobacteria bacterium]|nr:alkaline phosphatase [Deltaproteobacteria bacterium]